MEDESMDGVKCRALERTDLEPTRGNSLSSLFSLRKFKMNQFFFISNRQEVSEESGRETSCLLDK